MGKSLRDAPTRQSHTPAVGKSLRRGPLYPLGYPIMLPVVLDHLFGALTALESPKYSQNAHFSTFRALYISPPPGGQIQIRLRYPLRLGLNSLPSEFRANIPTYRATFMVKTREQTQPYLRLRRSSIPESEPPRFARWLKNLMKTSEKGSVNKMCGGCLNEVVKIRMCK